MRKLIIHAGIHRTGTTSIQEALAANRAALRQAGYLYPGDKNNHQEWSWGLFSGKKTPQEFFDFIHAEADESVHTILLSGEDFCIHKDLSWIQVLSGHLETHVRLFTRRQDEWLMSWYNQHVKWPWDRTKSVMRPDEFLRAIDEFYWLDYEWLASHWVDALGPDRVHITPVTPDQVASFLSDVAPSVSLIQPARGTNESVPTQALDVLRHINAVAPVPGLKIGPRARHRIVQSVLQFTEQEHVDPVFSVEERNAIMERFAAPNAAASARFLGGDPIVGEGRDNPATYVPLTEQETMATMAKMIISLAKAIPA